MARENDEIEIIGLDDPSRIFLYTSPNGEHQPSVLLTIQNEKGHLYLLINMSFYRYILVSLVLIFSLRTLFLNTYAVDYIKAIQDVEEHAYNAGPDLTEKVNSIEQHDRTNRSEFKAERLTNLSKGVAALTENMNKSSGGSNFARKPNSNNHQDMYYSGKKNGTYSLLIVSFFFVSLIHNR